MHRRSEPNAKQLNKRCTTNNNQIHGGSASVERERKKKNKLNKFIKTKCNEIYVIAIEMKMEFLNNEMVHIICVSKIRTTSFVFYSFTHSLILCFGVGNSLKIIINFRKTKMLNTWLVVVGLLASITICYSTICCVFFFSCCCFCVSQLHFLLSTPLAVSLCRRCARHCHRADILIYLMVILYLVPPLYRCYLRILALAKVVGEKENIFFSIEKLNMVHSHDCVECRSEYFILIGNKDNDNDTHTPKKNYTHLSKSISFFDPLFFFSFQFHLIFVSPLSFIDIHYKESI